MGMSLRSGQQTRAAHLDTGGYLDVANGGTVPDAMIQPPGGADPEAPQ
jgi:hypothetical protein